MSPQRISRSPDLQRLRDEGYDVSVQDNHVVVRGVPYVNAHREVKRGTLVSELTLAGDVTAPPKTHVVMFGGEYPCDQHGTPIENIRHASNRQELGPGLVVDHSFSSKPAAGYADYYEKMSTYATILASPAAALDPSATPKTFPVVVPDDDESVFQYLDTASSRAGITEVTRKLAGHRVAIVGTGGTGSYILDLVAKTPVAEIHLFDGDTFFTHNAFRAPGAPSLDELRAAPRKVAYLARVYARMHRHIIPHEYYIDATTVGELCAMSFVFLALDKGTPKKVIMDELDAAGVPYIDVGMGVELVDGALLGILATTSSTPSTREQARRRIPCSDGNGDAAYEQNIQIADLNALNAALAVIRWKKQCGFYHDREREHFSAYTIDGNVMVNEDQT